MLRAASADLGKSPLCLTPMAEKYRVGGKQETTSHTAAGPPRLEWPGRFTLTLPDLHPQLLLRKDLWGKAGLAIWTTSYPEFVPDISF